MSIQYDLITIGAGPGGIYATMYAANRGFKCALIDRQGYGGECMNWGCIPTKSLVHSVAIQDNINHAMDLGLVQGETLRLSFSAAMNRQRSIVEELKGRGYKRLDDLKVDFFQGSATITEPGQVRVDKVNGTGDSSTLTTSRIIVATGSSAWKPPIPGADLPGVLTNREILSLNERPQRLVIIGCSYVGVEFGRIFSGLGTEVHLISRRHFLNDFDDAPVRIVRQSMETAPNLSVEIEMDIEEIQDLGTDRYRVVYVKNGVRKTSDADAVLIACGRTPSTEGLLSENLTVKQTDSGIKVDDYLETSIPGIYAIGDVLGGHMLAHSAAAEGEIAAENCLGGKKRMNNTAVPRCVFSSPELAAVGMSEKEADASGLLGKDLIVTEFMLQTNPMAIITGKTLGFSRLLFERGSGIIMGGSIVGPRASDLIAELALAVRCKVTVSDLADLPHFHPSLAETTWHSARMAVLGEKKQQRSR